MTKRKTSHGSTSRAIPVAPSSGTPSRWLLRERATDAIGARLGGDPAGQSYVTLLGLRSMLTPDIIETVQKGLPFEAFERFVATTAISSAEAATLMSIPVRTLSRRKQEGRLQPDESDRLLRSSRIVGRAIGLFEGDRDEAKQWLMRPQPALGGARPLALASTDVGSRAVERLIDQLEQGVFV